ncbi:MAG: hypothetical protein ACR2RB_05290, partial [Gammaproteobacteria bacterium]
MGYDAPLSVRLVPAYGDVELTVVIGNSGGRCSASCNVSVTNPTLASGEYTGNDGTPLERVKLRHLRSATPANKAARVTLRVVDDVDVVIAVNPYS